MDRVTFFPFGPRAAVSVLLLAGLLSLASALALPAPARASANALVQQEKIAGQVGAKARFGFGAAISADGNTALVSARKITGTGEGVWVFARSGTTWTRQGALNVPSEGGEGCPGEGECEFTGSLALSGDGNTALVGDPLAEAHRGAVLVFTRSGSTWTQQPAALTPAKVTARGHFGRSVGLSSDGATAIVGGPGDANRGAAWIFSRAGSSWTERLKLIDSAGQGADRFGRSVAISQDAGTVLIGAPGAEHGNGAAWVFPATAGGTEAGVKLVGSGEAGKGQFGLGAALAGDGATALISARSDEGGDGAAWVFARSGSSWSQQGPKLTVGEAETGSKVGYSAALSADGRTALLGAPRDSRAHGTAWIFRRSASTWTQTEKLIGEGESGAAWFGASAALSQDGRTALVGGIRDSARDGAAWVFQDNSEPPGEPPEEPVIPGEPIVVPPPQPPVQNGSTTTVTTVTQLAGSGVLGSTSSTLPAPKLAVSANLTPLSGRVLVRLPGSKHFVLLTGAVQVPFRTIIDVRHGKVSLTTARRSRGTQTAIFYSGMFRITQKRDGRVTAALVGGDFTVCPTAAERLHLAHASAKRSSRRHTVRKLWAEGHGSYSTKGNYATGAVLGTRWLTEDRCNGTLIHVLTDKVTVTNLANHRHRTVRAGHSYLAKAPG